MKNQIKYKYSDTGGVQDPLILISTCWKKIIIWPLFYMPFLRLHVSTEHAESQLTTPLLPYIITLIQAALDLMFVCVVLIGLTSDVVCVWAYYRVCCDFNTPRPRALLFIQPLSHPLFFFTPPWSSFLPMHHLPTPHTWRITADTCTCAHAYASVRDSEQSYHMRILHSDEDPEEIDSSNHTPPTHTSSPFSEPFFWGRRGHRRQRAHNQPN